MENHTFRYEYAGDEFVYVEISEEMSLEANFYTMAICKKLEERELEGIIDICPGNSSYLVRVDPEVLHPDKLIKELKILETLTSDLSNIEMNARLIDIPVLFEDQCTFETVMRFRDRHQDPNSTDLEYCARINGYKTKDDFIEALTGTPYIVTMLGFVPGLPFSYQLVPREKQIRVPKYIRPRTYTPERAFGFGGCFGLIYPGEGAGGYQLFGRTPVPVFDGDKKLPDFKHSAGLPRKGDIIRYRKCDLNEYTRIRKEVEEGTYRFLIKDFTYTLGEVINNLSVFSEKAMRRLYNDQSIEIRA